MTQTLTFYHVFIYVGFAVRDPHPADRRARRGRPQMLPRVDPASRLAISGQSLLRGVAGLPLGAGLADQVLLVGQAQHLERGAVPAGVGPGQVGGTNGEDRMQEETLAFFRRAADRAQALDGQRSMAEREVCGVLEEQVAAGGMQLGPDQPAMAGLDGVRGGLATVEEVVDGVDVILAKEQLGDGLARLTGEGLGVGHDPFPPGAMPQPNPLELLACPDIWGRLVVTNRWQHGGTLRETPANRPVAHATKFSGMTSLRRGGQGGLRAQPGPSGPNLVVRSSLMPLLQPSRPRRPAPSWA